jgi:hypothetical protein
MGAPVFDLIWCTDEHTVPLLFFLATSPTRFPYYWHLAQRHSGRERIEFDQYETVEPWITEALLPHLPAPSEGIPIWEPACGSGQMVKVLRDAGYTAHATDIQTGTDFLARGDPAEPVDPAMASGSGNLRRSIK